MKRRMFSVLRGQSNFILHSDWHFSSSLSAVLYVLHVLFAIPKFPISASELFTSSGKFIFRNKCELQLPALLYFAEPGMLAGTNVFPAQVWSKLSWSRQRNKNKKKSNYCYICQEKHFPLSFEFYPHRYVCMYLTGAPLGAVTSVDYMRYGKPHHSAKFPPRCSPGCCKSCP
jgi:hypothetical protein